MKILLATVPDGPLWSTIESDLLNGGDQTQANVWMPHGVLRIARFIETKGYPCDIYDISSLRGSDDEIIKNLKKIKPTVIGLGAGLTHCYPNLKRLSKIIRKLFPDAWIITGGAITSSANVILTRTETDICVVGDGELPFIKLLEYIDKHPKHDDFDYDELSKIKGLGYLKPGNSLNVNGNGEALSASEASDLHYPDYEVLNRELEKFSGVPNLVNRFFGTINSLDQLKEFMAQQLYPEAIKFYENNKNKKVAEIRSAQGCVARCTFCQRYIKGYRPYSPQDFESHLIELKEKHNVALLFLNDENALSNKKQAYQIAKVFKKHNMYWTAQGVRATTCTYEDLKFYKENNLLAIRFGIESGSQKILDIMEKKITIQNARNALENCKKLKIGVATDMFMLGMPGETTETVLESAKLSGELRYMVGKNWNVENTPLAMAIPGTPLYEYSQQIGVIGASIEEEEDYLYRTSEFSNKDILTYLNKTTSKQADIHYWTYLYRLFGKRIYTREILKSNKSLKNKIIDYYENCIKASSEGIEIYFNKIDKSFKNNLKRYFLHSFQFVLTLSVTFLPKKFLFFLIKMAAYYDFSIIKKRHEEKVGKQKHNCFMNLTGQNKKGFSIYNNTDLESEKSINISLRKVVAKNREQLEPVITEEAKSLQILAAGQ